MSKTAAVFTAALLAAACTRDEDAALVTHDLTRPFYSVADLPDDVTAHQHGGIVVDFKDGTTKAQFDAIEQQWGIDLELADEEEGVDSAITVAATDLNDEDEAALLEKI